MDSVLCSTGKFVAFEHLLSDYIFIFQSYEIEQYKDILAIFELNNPVMLSRRLINKESLTTVIQRHSTFTDTIYLNSPELLYGHGEIELYSVDFDSINGSTIVHLMLTFPLIHSQVPYTIYDIVQVDLHL